MLVKKRLVAEIMQRGKHRAVEHIVTVEQGYPVVERNTVARLRIDGSREAVVFINVVIEIKVVVLGALGNGIVDVCVGNIYPRVDIGIDRRQILEINGILGSIGIHRGLDDLCFLRL